MATQEARTEALEELERWPLLKFTVDPADRRRLELLRKRLAARRLADIARAALHRGLDALERAG